MNVRNRTSSGHRTRRGVSLLEIVGVISVTMLVLSTTSMAIFRVSHLNQQFKNVGIDETNRHRTLQELREKIHAAERIELVDKRNVRLGASHWPSDVEWDLEQLPVMSHWNWDIPTRWRLERGLLQILDDRPGIDSPEVLFEAAIGLTRPRAAATLLPPLETLP